MKHVMVDLETLGNTPGCVILSIGAVGFCPVTGIMGERFYRVVNTLSAIDAGLEADASTQEWWSKQSKEAQQVLLDAGSPDGSLNSHLKDVLNEFNDFLRSEPFSDVRVWGNGSDFDNAILAVAYKRCGIKPAWEFWNNRCFRTLKNSAPQIKMERSGTHHNALDDAVTQARHALAILRADASNPIVSY